MLGGEWYFTLDNDGENNADELVLIDAGNIVVPHTHSHGGGNPHD